MHVCVCGCLYARMSDLKFVCIPTVVHFIPTHPTIIFQDLTVDTLTRARTARSLIGSVGPGTSHPI